MSQEEQEQQEKLHLCLTGFYLRKPVKSMMDCKLADLSNNCSHITTAMQTLTHNSNPFFQEEMAKGKSTNWPELEIAGTIRNLSPSVWKMTHLTALYLNDNCLKSLPPAISLLIHLRRLDLANNKLR